MELINKVESGVYNYVKHHQKTPSHIVMHPITLEDFRREIYGAAGWDIGQVGKGMKYRGIDILRSPDVEPGEIVI